MGARAFSRLHVSPPLMHTIVFIICLSAMFILIHYRPGQVSQSTQYISITLCEKAQ